MNDEYLKSKDVCRILGINPRTLFEWTHTGKITYIKTKGGQYRYPKKDIITTEKDIIKKNFCYCRVSTRGQLDDLERQVRYFTDRYPNHIIIRDIGSGLNFKRKGLKTILDEAIKGNIGEIVVTHKDRLCRFGFDLFENIIQTYSNGSIMVLNKTETSPQTELVNDLLSIITVFSSRLYGLRSHSVKKEIKDTLFKNIEGTIFTDSRTERTDSINDGSNSLVL
jgi:excisionase family DNA binding protein